ncbi:hypothetical protein AB433_16450 [Croceicoccus naphthovorans]|uniref:RNA-binding S4 domain-containing protein n=2 Tax=Croceicoccus naphthovorans TaxID=1348774 RepID=A0A0G3XK44_9SPHN|nr:hypothetical protein AB433_16450 [Croceicoccus naphthovorans]
MLRLNKTRSAAQALLCEGHVRINGRRVIRCSQPVHAGDVLTLPHDGGVRVIRVLTLPARRGPPTEAHSHYEEIESVSQQA